MSLPPFVSIKKFDGSYKKINLNQVVSVEMILNKGDCYYEVVDTNGKTHLSDTNPLATKATMYGHKVFRWE